jgi:protein-S-isoprenylcysteine O-methyltransferase Ste14
MNDFLGHDFPPGPKFVPMYVVINLQKGGTIFFCLWLMHVYQNFSTPALMYTACHGAYGLVWLLKHLTFDDAQWRTKQTLVGAMMGFGLVLGPYWLAPYLLISRSAEAASDKQCCFAAVLSIVGMVVMMAADAEKHFTLKYSKGLITRGMFKHVRHPNYLGEMMIYGGFALMVNDWRPWAVLAWVWIELFHTNMMFKEASMSRYKEWKAYEKCTLGPTAMTVGALAVLALPWAAGISF